MAQPPPIKTRQPTGKPPWPMLLLAGVEKSGKSYKAAEASASPMVHRTFWIGIGEDDPDEYGLVPGARFEIVEHDGTYRGILNAILAASAQLPGDNGEPNLIVLDSTTRLWTLLSDSAQQTANERWANRKNNQGKDLPEDGVKITHDLWNIANNRWQHIIDALRAHQGPSIITSRLKEVTVFDKDGNPTKERRWKADTQGSAPYDVGAVVQLRASYPEQDEAFLTGVRSLRYEHQTDRQGRAKVAALPDDWSFEDLWTKLGLAEAAAGPRVHAHTVAQSESAETAQRDELLEEVKVAALGAGVSLQQISDEWAQNHNGQHIAQTTDLGGLELLRDDLRAQATNPQVQEKVAEVQVQVEAATPLQTNAAGAQAPTGRNAVAARAEVNEQERVARVERAKVEEAARAASAPSAESKDEKLLRLARRELEQQAEWLGKPKFEDHAAPVLNKDGSLKKAGLVKFIVSQRAAAVEALRKVGDPSVAEAYAEVGEGFPLDVDRMIATVEAQEDQPLPATV